MLMSLAMVGIVGLVTPRWDYAQGSQIRAQACATLWLDRATSGRTRLLFRIYNRRLNSSSSSR